MQIFILHTQEQTCSNCGAIEQSSALYTATEMPRLGRANKLLPAATLGPADTVHRIDLPHRTVPVCTTCVDSRRISSDLYSRWQETLRRKVEFAMPTADRPTVNRQTEDLS